MRIAAGFAASDNVDPSKVTVKISQRAWYNALEEFFNVSKELFVCRSNTYYRVLTPKDARGNYPMTLLFRHSISYLKRLPV